MHKEDAPRFIELLDGVFRLLTHGKYVPDPESAALWFKALARFEFEVVRAAFSAHILDPEHGRFLPRPADITRLIEGDPEAAALLAWGEVYQAACSGGGSFSGLYRQAVDSIGGMQALRLANVAQTSQLQRTFVSNFKVLRARCVSPPLLAKEQVSMHGSLESVSDTHRLRTSVESALDR